MKKLEFVVTKQNNVDTIKYDLTAADVYDDKAATKATTLNNIIPFQYNDVDGKRSITSYAHEDTNLEAMYKTTLTKKEVLCILSGIASVFEMGTQGIPVSYIVRDAKYIYINKTTYAVKCVIVPIKQDVIALSEIPAFFRSVISSMRFSNEDKDNYVATILTLINQDDFTVSKLKALIDGQLENMGCYISKDNGLNDITEGNAIPVSSKDVRVNKLGVMTNMQNSMRGPQPGMPQMPPQMGGMQPGMPQMGQPQMPPQMGGMQPGMPQMGQPQVPPQMGGMQPGMPQMGQPQVPPQMGGMKPGMPQMGQPQVPPQMGGMKPGMPQMGQPQVPPQMGGMQPGMPQMGQPQVPPQMGGMQPGMPQMGQPQVSPQMPKPVMPEAPKPVAPEMPKPVMPEAPKPVAPEAPKPVAPEMPKPVMPEAPKPVMPEAPKPVAPEMPKPVMPEAPKAMELEAPKPVMSDTSKLVTPSPVAPAMATPTPATPVMTAPTPVVNNSMAASKEIPSPVMPSQAIPTPVVPQPNMPVAPKAPITGQIMPNSAKPVEDIPEGESNGFVGQLGTKPIPHIVRKKTGEIINITKSDFAIGKSKTKADYAIEDNSAISRVHCIIVQKDGVNYIKDNNSTNHTYINGVELEPGKEVLLKNKTLIQMGDEEFTFLLRKGE